jgi:hypothetical protein
LNETELESRYSVEHGVDFVNDFAKEHNINLNPDIDTDRFREYKKWRPFDLLESSPWYDSDEMFGIYPGFDAVIGNPPYIHLEDMKELSKNLYLPLGYKSYEARGDIYALFYERGIQLLKDKGVLCYITSNKWMRAAYGESLRNFFSGKTNPKLLIDFAGQKIFDATVDTNILLTTKDDNQGYTAATIVKEDCLGNLSLYVPHNSTMSKFEGSGSWTILSDIEQRIKAKIEAAGVPLKDWDIRINYGIKTGCNEAFIIDGTTKDRLIAEDPKSAEIIRPILRGRDIKRYSYSFADKWIIATFPALHYDIEEYPAVKAWLQSAVWHDDIPNGYGQLKLEQTGATHTVDGIKFKSRKKTGNKWFETQDQIGYWDDFAKQKIVWAELARTGNAFALDINELIVLNTAYILVSPSLSREDLEMVLIFLNSRCMLYYLNLITSKFDATGWRWLKQFVELLPIPRTAGSFVGNVTEQDSFVYRAYGLDSEEINYLKTLRFHR